MKNILYIIFPILGILYIYGNFSFFYWGVNAEHWSEGGRYLFLMISFVVAVASVLVAYNINEKKI